MKKVLYIGKYNGIIGGIERYMQNSALLLRRYGFEIHYLYMEKGGKDLENFAGAFDILLPFSPDNMLLETSDMIIIHNIIPVEFLRFLPENKTFFFAHDHNIYCRRHHYYTPFCRKNCHRKYNKFICAACSLFRNAVPPLAEYRKFPALVLSDFMAGNLRKNGFEKVIKLPAFIRIIDTERSFMPDGILRILFLGQLIRGKGADLMLKTLFEFAKLDMPFECTIAGDGKDRQMLENMVEKFKLCDKVHFTGFISNTTELWKNCDLFFFPIRWQEPFGLVGLEAMAHGVPVMAFDLGGVREWLAVPDCGIAIPEKAIIAAAGMLGLWARNRELLESMGRRGRELAGEKFSEEKFVKKFDELFGVLK